MIGQFEFIKVDISGRQNSQPGRTRARFIGV